MYLFDHASSSTTESKINELDWDYVILQGVGTNTAYPDYFTDHPVYPALVTIKDKISQNCESTKIIYCMPWAFEDGMTWYQDWTDTYEDMQIKIFATTLNYSEKIGFIIAPVGWAWYTVLEEQDYPLHYLHMSDWNHPSLKGSYLMACVIFSTLYLESSVGLSYFGGLLKEEANYFQSVASHTVLSNLSLWNIVDNNDNNPPNRPDLPSGPVNGKPGETYTYSTTTYDQDGDSIFYKWSYGDGSQSPWLSSGLGSGELCTMNHTWDKKGEYELRVKAKDEHGLESEWSDALYITISKNKESIEKAHIFDNNGIIIILAFPTEFYEYKTNYTFWCKGRGYGLWITPEGIHFNTFCGAVLEKNKFFGIENPVIVFGIKIR
jgi:hypothetical protein